MITFFPAVLMFLPPSIFALEYPIEVFARHFEVDRPIMGAKIHKVSGSHTHYLGTTDEQGTFHFSVSTSLPFSLQIETVDENFDHPRIVTGLIEPGTRSYYGKENHITFQVPLNATVNYLTHALQMRYNSVKRPDTCHIVTTVTGKDKSLDDCPHGLAGATAELFPNSYEGRYYFDIIDRGPLSCKTDLFFDLLLLSYANYFYEQIRQPLQLLAPALGEAMPPNRFFLDKTSEDGGVIFFNVKARSKPYTLRTRHPEYLLTEVSFVCHPGAMINISPPQGPKIIY